MANHFYVLTTDSLNLKHLLIYEVYNVLLEKRLYVVENTSLNTDSPIISITIPSPPNLTSALITSGPNTSDDCISSIVSTYLNEEKEKMKWRLNLIVYNLAESSSDDSAIRQKDDIAQATSIFQKYGQSYLARQTWGEVKIIKIYTNFWIWQATILWNTFKQQNSDDIKDIFITLDLMPKEQEANTSWVKGTK